MAKNRSKSNIMSAKALRFNVVHQCVPDHELVAIYEVLKFWVVLNDLFSGFFYELQRFFFESDGLACCHNCHICNKCNETYKYFVILWLW